MFRTPFPILHSDDVARAIRFYCDTLDFTMAMRWPEEGAVEFAFLEMGDTGIGIASRQPPALPDWPADRGTGDFQLCIYTDDTAAAAARLRAAGAPQITAPRSMPWGETLAFFEDPDGNLVHITASDPAPA